MKKRVKPTEHLCEDCGKSIIPYEERYTKCRDCFFKSKKCNECGRQIIPYVDGYTKCKSCFYKSQRLVIKNSNSITGLLVILFVLVIVGIFSLCVWGLISIIPNTPIYLENLTNNTNNILYIENNTPVIEHFVYSPNLTQMEMGFHNKINEQRRLNGLNNLDFNEKLSDIARDHSEDMAKRQYFLTSGQGHIDPEGHDFVWRNHQAGFYCDIKEYQGSTTRTWDGAENLNVQRLTNMHLSEEELISRAVSDLMNSPLHKAQILNSIWQTEGIGVYILTTGNYQEIYFTQLFC